MGLGKTPLTLAALEELRRQGKLSKPVLVVALATLKTQWADEIAKFTDRKSIVIEGTASQRAKQYVKAQSFSYIIVGYEQVRQDWKTLRDMSFSALVCDEATAIKNFRAQRTRRIKELARKVEHRYALTGTPIENGAAEELFSIMEFVDRRVLGDFKAFDHQFIQRNSFGGIEKYVNIPDLHAKLDPQLVRRTQLEPAVAPYLPDTIYRPPIRVFFDHASRVLYTRIVRDLVPVLRQLSEMSGGFSLDAHYGRTPDRLTHQDLVRSQASAMIAALRQLCVDPQVLQASAVHFGDDTADRGSKYAAGLLEDDALLGVTKAPKIDAVVRYTLDHLSIDPSYKVIVFVTWLDAVDTLVSRFQASGVKAVPFTGELPRKQREDNKTAFQTDPDVRVFVSSDAGGYGVNLPQANLLINVDLPWSAGALKQRNGRVQRASSNWKSVVVQDFLMDNSLDVRQHAVVHQKTAVASALLDKEGVDSAGELVLEGESLLRFLLQAIN